MAKALKIILPILLIACLITLIILYVVIWKPNADFNKNRNALSVSDSSENTGIDNIHFLPTASSDAILIESDGHFALVDCAEDSDNPRGFEELVYDGYEEYVLEYLKKVATAEDGKVHLDFVLGTHSHSDHIGGFDTVIADEDIIIEKAYLKNYDASRINDHEVTCWDNQEVYDQMVEALQAKSIPIISEISHDTFKLGNFDITIFNTEYDMGTEPIGENDNSLGVLVEKAGKRVFLAGDIDNKTGDEDRIGAELGEIDILKVGHHSYSQSTSKPWLQNLKPKTCVVTNDYENTDKRTLRKITKTVKAPILVTGTENGVIVSISDDGEITYYNNI